MFYIIIIIAMFAITIANFFMFSSLLGVSFLYVFCWVCFLTASVIIVDLICAGIVRWLLPERWFSVDKMKFFCASRSKCSLYEKLGIKKWKDKIPELGKLTSFRKNKIMDPKNNEYISRYILEANYGVIVHVCGMVFGYVVILLNLKLPFVGLGVAVVNTVYCWLPFAILRYNLPKLHRLYKINEKAAARRVKTERLAKDAETAENEVAVGTTVE